jgi:exonuclease SbcD
MKGKFRFAHLSDTHLGLRQYGEVERAKDMARSLKDALQQAVDAKVDFVLIAGDFFESQDTNPDYYLHAIECLKVTRDAGVPVYAIAGNHDKASWSKRSCWLDVLNESGYFHLLAPTFPGDGSVQLPPWDPESRSGAIVEPPGAPYRVIGVPHLGTHTTSVIPGLADALPKDDRFNLVMMHLGLTGQIPDTHDALEKETLDPLKPKVGYLALGHYHKRYDIDGWIFNPGGTENRSSSELSFPHGFYIVDVKDGAITIDFRPGLRRSYHILDEPLKPADNHETLKARILAVPDLAARPIITINVQGTLMDAYTNLDLTGIEEAATAASGALIVRLRPRIEKNEVHVSIDDKSSLDRGVLEADVLAKTLPNHFPQLAPERIKDAVAEIQSIKNGALSKAKPDELYEQFKRLTKLEPQPKVATPEVWA